MTVRIFSRLVRISGGMISSSGDVFVGFTCDLLGGNRGMGIRGGMGGVNVPLTGWNARGDMGIKKGDVFLISCHLECLSCMRSREGREILESNH